MKKISQKFLLIFIFTLNFATNSFAELSFEVSGSGALSKTKILFYGFSSDKLNMKIDSSEILLRIEKNLKTTNLFEVVQEKSLPYTQKQIESQEDLSESIVTKQLNRERMVIPDFIDEGIKPAQNIGALTPSKTPFVSVEMVPDFKQYNSLDVGAVVIAELTYDIEGNLEIRIRLWDVLDQRQLFGKFYSASKDNYKKMANLISNEIYKSLTSEKIGHFNSRISYVSQTGNVKKRIKKIAIVDFDGENRHFLTNGTDLVLTPVFSKTSNELFYLSYKGYRPQIYKMNLYDNRSKKVGNFSATTLSAAPHPHDKNIVLLSAIFNGNSDIYEMHMDQNRAVRLTKNYAIDTTPDYSPSGKKIAFASDRGHLQQIYIMDSNARNLEKISRGRGSYSKPIFSPDGSKLAFTVMKNGQFYVGTMNIDGSNERLLTNGYVVEGAKWSPNGRYILYSKAHSAYGRNSIPRLYTIDVVTGFEYELPLPKGEGATDPDWILLD